jgi:hypothetical protein
MAEGASRDLPVPGVIRSRQDLLKRGVEFPVTGVAPTKLPITQEGTTYSMAQEATWVDSDHFAIGRWDGSMSVFSFIDSPTSGPIINKAVNSPAFEGVQMIAWLPYAMATSNDYKSMVLWASPAGSWSDLQPIGTYSYDSALGVANSGLWIPVGNPTTLVVGHSDGWISLWNYVPPTRQLTFLRAVNIQNPHPVNPWDLHNIRAIQLVTIADGGVAYVATGSEDGYVCIIQVPSGQVMSQTVYNPEAQRGINGISVFDYGLLIANCSVGPTDYNLWYFAIQMNPWGITLQDKANLKVNPNAPQVFNFCSIWAEYAQGACWFASTEEGALWQGTVSGSTLNTIGYQQLTPALGCCPRIPGRSRPSSPWSPTISTSSTPARPPPELIPASVCCPRSESESSVTGHG